MFSKQRRIVVNNRYTQTASMRNGGVMIRLTLKKLIIVGIILLVLLVWAFFVGVLVGQGISADESNGAAGAGNSTIVGSEASDGEAAITTPDMTQAPQVAETPPQAQTPPAATQAAKPKPGVTSADSAAAGGANDAVISPQELSALSELKGKPAPPDATKVNDEGRQTAAASQPQKTQAQQTQARTTQNSGATANTGRPEDPAPKATTPTGPGIFDYQYQVAATTDLEGAKRLVSQLRAEGLRASMVQGSKEGSKLYRVHVDFRGTPSDTNQLREKLSKFGINRVLLKTKVATQ